MNAEPSRMDPLPDYVPDWLLARWIGIPVWEFDAIPISMLEEARTVMIALDRAQDANNRKGHRK